MVTTVNESKRNPQTGKLEKTGRKLVKGYAPREGGGYKTVSVPQEGTPEGTYKADSFATQKAEEKARQEAGAAERNRLAAEQEAAKKALNAKYVTITTDPKTGKRVYVALKDADAEDARKAATAEINKIETYRSYQRNKSQEIVRQSIEEEQKKQQANINPETGKPYGTVYATPKPKTPSERVQRYLDENIQKQSKKAREAENSDATAAFKANTAAFALGGVRGVKNLLDVDKTAKSAIETIKHPQQAAYAFGEQLRREPAATAGEIVIPSVAVGAAGAAIGAIKQVRATSRSAAGASTIEAELPSGATIDTSKSTIAVEAQGKQFKVQTETTGNTRPDLEGTRIRTEKTTIEIQELNKKGETKNTYEGFARAETQIKPTETGARTRGTFAQATNVKTGSIRQQGKTAGIVIREGDELISGAATEYTKTKKGKTVRNAEELTYQENPGEVKNAGVTVGKTSTVLEAEAPLSIELAKLEQKAFDLNEPHTIRVKPGEEISPGILQEANIKVKVGEDANAFVYGKAAPNTIYEVEYTPGQPVNPEIISHEKGHLMAGRNQLLGDTEEMANFLKHNNPDAGKEFLALQKAGLIEKDDFFIMYRRSQLPDESFAEFFKAYETHPEEFARIAPGLKKKLDTLNPTYEASVRVETPAVPQRLTVTLNEGVSGRTFKKLAKEYQTQGYSVVRTEGGQPVIMLQPQGKIRRTTTPPSAPTDTGLLTITTQRNLPAPSNAQDFAKQAVINIVREQNIATGRTAGATIGATRAPLKERQGTTERTEISFKPTQKPQTLPGTTSKPTQTPVYKPKAAQRGGQDEEQTFKQIQRERSEARNEQQRTPVQTPITETTPAILKLPIQEERLTPIQETTSTTTTVQPPYFVPPLTTLKPIVPPVSQTHKDKEEGYDVFLRRRGEFTKQNVNALSKGSALKLGAFLARNTSAASFKVLPSGTTTSDNKEAEPSLPDFYRSTRERGVLIQKRSERISTPGEKAEITYKGLRSRRGFFS